MAFGGFGKKGNDESGEGSAPAAPAGSLGGLTAFIDQGSEFEGKLSFKDTVRIDGHFSGEISSENTLIVGEPGSVQASIRSKTVVVSGSVEGDIVAERQIVLHKTACVVGDIQTGSLVVEDGAVLAGTVKMQTGDRAKPKASQGGTNGAKAGTDGNGGGPEKKGN